MRVARATRRCARSLPQFGLGSSRPVATPDVVTVKISGCSREKGGVGIDLTHTNVILDFRPGTAAERASESGTGFVVGDRVLSVDGIVLNGRVLTEVIQSAEEHVFTVERTQGWSGFSIEDTDVADEAEEDGFAKLNRLRTVVVQKIDGQLGINPEVHCAEGGGSPLVKVAQVLSLIHI